MSRSYNGSISVTCPPPPIDMATYQVFHAELSTQLPKFPLETPSGSRFRVDLADLRCGYDMTEISCYHGIWDLPLPTCQPGKYKPKRKENSIYSQNIFFECALSFSSGDVF